MPDEKVKIIDVIRQKCMEYYASTGWKPDTVLLSEKTRDDLEKEIRDLYGTPYYNPNTVDYVKNDIFSGMDVFTQKGNFKSMYVKVFAIKKSNEYFKIPK